MPKDSSRAELSTENNGKDYFKSKTGSAENTADPNIDQEIELLTFLTKKQQPVAQLDKKIGKSQSSYLQNFEQQFKYLEDEELIKMYLKNEGNGSSQKNSEKNLADIKANNNISIKNQADKDLDHKQFSEFLENVKSKALEN